MKFLNYKLYLIKKVNFPNQHWHLLIDPCPPLLTIVLDQHLLLTHVLDVDGAVDHVVWRGAVVLLHLLTLVALDLLQV